MKHCERFSSDIACAISLSTWSFTFSTTVGLKSRPVYMVSVGEDREEGEGDEPVSFCCTRSTTTRARALI